MRKYRYILQAECEFIASYIRSISNECRSKYPNWRQIKDDPLNDVLVVGERDETGHPNLHRLACAPLLGVVALVADILAAVVEQLCRSDESLRPPRHEDDAGTVFGVRHGPGAESGHGRGRHRHLDVVFHPLVLKTLTQAVYPKGQF